MNVVRNSGVAFDADRLFSKPTKQSIGGFGTSGGQGEGTISLFSPIPITQVHSCFIEILLTVK